MPNENNITTPTGAAASAALPIDVVLETLADGLQDRAARDAIEKISAHLQKGVTFDEALAKFNRTAPRYLTGLLRAAVQSGNLAEVCDGFLQLRESTARTANRLRSIMLYPILLGLALTALAFLFSGWVIPQFGEAYHEFDLELPYLTESVITFGPYLPWILLAALGALAATTVIPRLIGLAFLGHRLRGALPLVGRLYTGSAHQQFAALLANFVGLRLPITSALTYTGDLIADRNLGRAAYRVAMQVERGTSLAESFADSPHFDRSLTALVRWGESESRLEETLCLAAELFDDRVEERIHFLGRVVPSLVMVMVLSAALTLPIALLLPLLNMTMSLG